MLTKTGRTRPLWTFGILAIPAIVMVLILFMATGH